MVYYTDMVQTKELLSYQSEECNSHGSKACSACSRIAVLYMGLTTFLTGTLAFC